MGAVLSFVAGVVGWIVGSPVLGMLPPKVGTVLQAFGGILSVLSIRKVSGSPSQQIAATLDKYVGKSWKTVTGILCWALGVALSPDVFPTIPPSIGHWLQLIGQVLTGLGIWHSSVRPTA